MDMELLHNGQVQNLRFEKEIQKTKRENINITYIPADIFLNLDWLGVRTLKSLARLL